MPRTTKRQIREAEQARRLATKIAHQDSAAPPPKTKAELRDDLIRSLNYYRDRCDRNGLIEWCNSQIEAIAGIKALLAHDNADGYRRAAYLMASLHGGQVQREVGIALVATLFAEKADGLAGADPDECARTLADEIAILAIEDRGRSSVSSDRTGDIARDYQELGRREAYASIAQIVWSYRDKILAAYE